MKFINYVSTWADQHKGISIIFKNIIGIFLLPFLMVYLWPHYKYDIKYSLEEDKNENE